MADLPPAPSASPPSPPLPPPPSAAQFPPTVPAPPTPSPSLQRLRVLDTDRRPCTAILQRISDLHRLSLTSSSAPSSSFPPPSSPSTPPSPPSPSSWRMAGDDPPSPSPSSDADDDCVLVSPPTVHLLDCHFALNDRRSTLAVAYSRHLFLHPLSPSDAAASSAAPTSHPRYRAESGEVDPDQRVQSAHNALYADDAPPSSSSLPTPDDEDAALHARLLSDRSPITALCWMRCEERDWLLVGYASGYLRCYHSTGRLVFAHPFHSAPVRAIRPFHSVRSAFSARLSNLGDTPPLHRRHGRPHPRPPHHLLHLPLPLLPPPPHSPPPPRRAGRLRRLPVHARRPQPARLPAPRPRGPHPPRPHLHPP